MVEEVMKEERNDETGCGGSKRIRLFGFEVDLAPQASSNSSTTSSSSSSSSASTTTVATTTTTAATAAAALAATKTSGMEIKRYGCQFCLKEFPNSQALGGHQNAHKKERMRKKRLELQARKAGISFYLQPFIKSHHGSDVFGHAVPWFYGPTPTYCGVPEVTVFEELDQSSQHLSGFAAAVQQPRTAGSFTVLQFDGPAVNDQRGGGVRPSLIARPLPLQLPHHPKVLGVDKTTTMNLQLGLSMQGREPGNPSAADKKSIA